ncbi:MAG: ParB/RepB/Spo0J family partition protein [Clostridia bacterium]|nr:ParB/RepB/Spo0J family partition protein [Clostridia bacterium]MBO7288589.1 ParB/RepB/Spo0J family partition protein [Clostridia bacterium]
MVKKKGLGKGLGALLTDEKSSIDSDNIKEIKIIDVEPNKSQPRKSFNEEKLEELADSIRQNGVITPILVQEAPNGYYTIIAGERRWRAAKKAGLKEIPAIVKKLDNQKLFEISLIENLQREDLNPVEEAFGYKNLMEEYGLNQEEVAQKVSKSRSGIANSLRLLNLPKDVLNLLSEGAISVGHAKVLLSLPDDNGKLQLCSLTIEKNLSVRELEAEVKKYMTPAKKETKENLNIKLAYEKIEKSIEDILGTKVKISGKKNKGKIQIDYYSAKDLERIVKIISGTEKIDL